MRLLLLWLLVVNAAASTVQAEYVKRGSVVAPISSIKPTTNPRFQPESNKLQHTPVIQQPVQQQERSQQIQPQQQQQHDLSVLKGKSKAKTLLQRILSHSFKEGVSGAFAGMFHTVSLLWLKTIINYQYRHGVSFTDAAKLLYKEGGILRFYHGITFALIQSPLARFGAVAANEAMQLLPGVVPALQRLPPSLNTAIGSLIYSGWRMLLMPIDTSKTLLQVEGKAATSYMLSQLAHGNIAFLYQGTLAMIVITFVAHYPWFITYNLLHKLIPETDNLAEVILRAGFIGFVAAATSDVAANPFRILKTIKQTCASCSYQDALEQVLAKDGLRGLFLRGLGTRMLNNCLQSMIFTVFWRMIRYVRAKMRDARKRRQAQQAAAAAAAVATGTNTTTF